MAATQSLDLSITPAERPCVNGDQTLFGMVVDLSGSFRVGWTLLALVLLGAAVLTSRIAEPLPLLSQAHL